MSASKSGLIQNLLEYHRACVKVEKRVIGKRPDKVEKGVIGKRPDKNAASEKQKEILNFVKKEKDASKSAVAAFTFVKKEKAAFTFVKKENDAVFVKKEKDEEAEVAYYRGAASKSGEIEEAESVASSLSHEEVAEEEVGDLQFGVVHAAYDWSSDDDNVIIDAAATPKSTPPSYAGKTKRSEMTDTQWRNFWKNRSKHMWKNACRQSH